MADVIGWDAHAHVIGDPREFPFAPGHDEEAWKQNRRAHFMLTAK